MSKLPRLFLTAALLITAAVPAATASDSLHVKHSAFRAAKNNQKHPSMLTQIVTVNQDVVEPRLCIAYGSTMRKSQGRAVVDILLKRVDGSEEAYRLADRVRNNSFLKCTKAGQVEDMFTGAQVVFEYNFSGAPRMKRGEQRTDLFEVNSVVVADGFPLPLGTVGVSPGKEEDDKTGGWMHSSNYNLQSSKKSQKHMTAVTKMLVVAADTASPRVCGFYRNTVNKGGKGTVDTEVVVTRGEEVVQTINLTSEVEKNQAQRCKIVDDMLAGDIVEFHFTFSGMPRLRKKANSTDYAETSGVVSGNGKPVFASAPDDPTNPSPSPDPTPPPSGGLSSADIAAAGKLLIGNRPVQLWREKSSWGRGKWWVIGPGTKIDTSQLGNVIPGTVGWGNTIAAAVAEYERKMGKLPGSGSLSSTDVNMLVWYNTINSDGGPTSVRRSPSGGFYGEYYRPGKGAQHNGPYGSPGKALEWLRAQGL